MRRAKIMGRNKQFKMDKPLNEPWPEDEKCPVCDKETKAEDVKVYGNESGKRLLKLKWGHSVFK